MLKNKGLFFFVLSNHIEIENYCLFNNSNYKINAVKTSIYAAFSPKIIIYFESGIN